MVRYLYKPKMYGDSVSGGPSSFYVFINALRMHGQEKLITVSKTVGRFDVMAGIDRRSARY